ncbi:hypothetical protein AB0C84_20000 [Actinomadura sp. NPDC048955]|uniref:hypothetical protein n=1 Tax=Actinomadura TaxID=1988 RepID=UPI00340BDEEB
MTGPARRRASRRGRRTSRFAAAHLAGWLFADLMLVLFLVAMAVQPRAQLTTGLPEQKKPLPSGPRVLGQDFCDFLIPVQAEGLLSGSGGARADLLRKVDEALRGEHPSWLYGDEMRRKDARAACLEQLGQKLQVGFFLAYGARNDTGSGVTLGRNAAKAVKSGNPRFREAIYRAAWTGGEGDGSVQLVVFFYQN